eukprot:TRINITY_DN77337_c0_g1_i1.p1 TRINITY_DN77337_c0_g1~~TRINITY_DN77337_c0_g1_i1.p1  ORF type:complete len:368 (-),score=49.44 TRINITY_DN77337_c0_g1_i1:23-1126(-)
MLTSSPRHAWLPKQPATAIRAPQRPATRVASLSSPTVFLCRSSLACLGLSLRRRRHALRACSGVVGIDTEFVGVGKNTVTFGGSKNALARISIVEAGASVLMDCFVKVPEEVMDFRLAITGITQDAIDCGVDLQLARDWVTHLLHDRIVVGHNLTTDWKVIGYQHPAELVRDTASYKPLRPKDKMTKKPKLSDLAERLLGKSMREGDVHDSIEDALAALDVYLLHQTEWEASVAKKVLVPPTTSPGPPRPGALAPLGAAAEVARSKEQAVCCLQDPSMANARLSQFFQKIADDPGSNDFARKHFARVASTFAALPFPICNLKDLERPELRCIGKEGSKTRKMVSDLLSAKAYRFERCDVRQSKDLAT